MAEADATGSLAATFRLACARATTLAGIAAIAILVLGLALRIAGAKGELWLDEIYSLHLIDEMKARGDILWSLPIDNNHYLNTFYLYLVGPGAPPLVQRALSILLGVGTIAASGLIQARRGAAEALAAMILFAVTYPLVNAGSEARGYSGMMFCALLAIAATERAMRDPSRAHGLQLGAACCFGMLFQPIMAGMIGALMCWCALTAWQSTGSLKRALIVTRNAFSWTVRLLILELLIIATAIFRAGGYSLGGVAPFQPAGFTSGIARLFQALIGLPEATPVAVTAAIVLALIGIAVALRRRIPDQRTSLYLILIFGIPLGMFLARLPNTDIPRYYLLPGAAFLLLLADLFGQLWRSGRVAQGLAGAMLAAVLAGNAVELDKFIAAGRGDVSAMLQVIAAGGPAQVTSNDDVRDQPVIEYFERTMGVPVTFVGIDDVCTTRPGWILTSDPREVPEATTIGAPNCSLNYRRQHTFQPFGFSGFPWTLYKAEP